MLNELGEKFRNGIRYIKYGCLGFFVILFIGGLIGAMGGDKKQSQELASPKPSIAAIQSVASVSPTPTPTNLTESPALIEQSTTPAKSTSTQSSKANSPAATIENSSVGGDKDCGDFKTHAEAQAYFDSKGGSKTNNVDHLDGRDHDGIVCED